MKELKKSSKTLIPKCTIVDAFFKRFMGLMGKTHLSESEAYLFPKCNSIHTFFMRVPIDVILVTSEGKVVEVWKDLRPWRLLLPRKHVAHTIEMRVGSVERLGISLNDKLECEGVFT